MQVPRITTKPPVSILKGYKTVGGGHVKVYPYEEGEGAEKVLAMPKGGHNQFWGSFNTLA